MNLWVKHRGQLAVLAVALFFFSCQEDTSLLGYKNPNSKFNASYVEIPIESSVLLLDSLRTSNFSFPNELNRLLIGKYSDEKFGEVSSNAFTQFFTTTSTKLGSTASFDSVTLQLRFDLYTYGSTAVTPQSFEIYELEEDLKIDNRSNYFNKTEVAVKASPLGTKTFTINPKDFQEFIEDQEDTTIVIKVPLDPAFGKRIFDNAIRYRDAATVADSSFVKFSEFIKEFKGLAFKVTSGDKIVGFSPSATSSIITLHYHEDAKDSLALNLSFKDALSFNQIKSNRSTTELSAVTQYHQAYTDFSDNRYVQSGAGIFTKLDFTNFFTFRDTVSENIVINSAELVITNVDDSQAPPNAFILRVLKENNRQRVFSSNSDQDRIDYSLYEGFLNIDVYNTSQAVVVDLDSVFYIADDTRRPGLIRYSRDNKTYSGFLSRYFQQVIDKTEEKSMIKSFVLYPVQPAPAKSVNRVIFHKDNIKLRIKYTQPTGRN